MDTCWTPIGALFIGAGISILAFPKILFFPQNNQIEYTFENMARDWALFAVTLGSVLITLNTTGIFVSLFFYFACTFLWNIEIIVEKNTMSVHHMIAVVLNMLGATAATLTFVLCDKENSTNTNWWPSLLAMILAMIALTGGIVVSVCFCKASLEFPDGSV